MARRIMRGLGATAFGFGRSVVVQLLSIPIFLRYWGVGQYGEWLLLSTIPAYFAMSDVGFGSVAGNEMTMKVAEGDRLGALDTFQSTWAFVTGMSTALVGAAMIVFWSFPVERWLNLTIFSHTTTCVVATVLLCHVAISLQGGLVAAGYRCVGLYATETFWGNMSRLVESAGLLLVVVLGGGPVDVAVVYLALRTMNFFALRLYLKRRAPWIVFGLSHARRETVRRLAAPAAAFMGFPAGNALSMQGMITVVGVVLGPVAVVTLSAMRTLVNAVKQGMTMVNNTVWPELSMAYGAGNLLLAKRLHRYACQASLFIAISGAMFLALFGQRLIEVWTSGKIVMEPIFFHLMLLVIVANSLWYTSLVVPSAINRHERIAVYYLCSAAASLVLAVPLLRLWGLSGVAVALFTVDVVMSVYTIRLSTSLLADCPSEFIRSLASWRLLSRAVRFIRT